MYLLNTNLKGVSSMKLARSLRVNQKTAWFLTHRIRQAHSNQYFDLFDDPDDPTEKSSIEMDETYIGSLEKNKHNSKKRKEHKVSAQRPSQLVVGIKCIQTKKVKDKVTDTVDSTTD